MSKIYEVIKILEQFAPTHYQEGYDNSGLIVGNSSREVSGIVISLDCTEEVIEEAIENGCNLVVSHHPIIFGGIKKLNGKNYIERAVIRAIKHDVALYAIHTNLDNVAGGVNFKIAEILSLKDTTILKKKNNTIKKLVTFVPSSHVEELSLALHESGAGQIGKYKDCSFRVEGIGTFTPEANTKPFAGEVNKKSFEPETRLEMIFPEYIEKDILKTLFNTHPYEEVAYDLMSLDNENQEIGAGAIGMLQESMDATDFMKYLKEKMNLKLLKHTHLCKEKIRKVAVCGGAGSFLLKDAIRAGADVFITSDFKYHEYFDAEHKIIILDIGHYESEIFTKDLISEVITKKMTNIAVVLSEINTNPINYY